MTCSFLGRGRRGHVFVFGFETQTRHHHLLALFAHDGLAAHGAQPRQRPRKAGVGRDTGETHRRVLSNVLGDSGRVSDRGCDLVAHDAGRGRLFGEGAGAAGEEQLVVRLVFAGEKQVGAGERRSAEAHESSYRDSRTTHHSEQKRKRIFLLGLCDCGSGDDMMSVDGNALVVVGSVGGSVVVQANCLRMVKAK